MREKTEEQKEFIEFLDSYVIADKRHHTTLKNALLRRGIDTMDKLTMYVVNKNPYSPSYLTGKIRGIGETGMQRLLEAWLEWGYDYPFKVRRIAVSQNLQLL